MQEILEKHGFRLARMVGWSKTFYRQEHPNHEVVFNANIFTESSGKIWYGDLDLTLDEPKLLEAAKEIGESLYILWEMDGRFENENIDFELVKQKALKIVGL